jgi:rare lipoprotein A
MPSERERPDVSRNERSAVKHSRWRPGSVARSLRRHALVAALVAVLLVTGCARLRGVPHAPAPPIGHEELGRASWYGEPHHGRRTASGETYDMHGLTAAHRSFPFGTWLFVENLENGRTVELRVNDRGPFVDGRILDLSWAAARALGAIGAGIVPVRVRVLGDSPPRR